MAAMCFDGVIAADMVNLPGGPAAVARGFDVVVPPLRHLLDQITDGDHA